MKHLACLVLFTGCTLGESPSSGDDDDGSGGTPWDGPPVGGMRIVSGFAAQELAVVTGPGDSCGLDPPVVVGDLTADGVPELLLSCLVPGEGTEARNLHLLDGAAALGGVAAEVGVVSDAYTDGMTSLGDLDGDRLTEVGLGLAWSTLSDGDINWWYVRPGASLVGETFMSTDAWVVSGGGHDYANGPPQPIGDVDGDSVIDLAVGQHPGSNDEVGYFVSGGGLLAAGSLSAPTEALRTLVGFDDKEAADDFAPVGDVDSDGHPDVALVLGDTAGQYGGGNHVAATIVRGDSVSDPATTMRIHGSNDGRDRWGQVETLADLDADGLPELAVLLTTFRSSEENSAEVAVVPSSVLAAGADVDVAPFTLGGTFDQPRWLTTCDLDGDGLPELVSDAGIWDGSALLVPGTLPVGPGVGIASCAGDLDGVPGSELVRGTPEGY